MRSGHAGRTFPIGPFLSARVASLHLRPDGNAIVARAASF
ncbi:hypothetical protein LG3211_5343 [Lysobacter gummosus]|nr:hypothetical protein LG3211_5343 [Lysobacter gummosus]